MPLTLDGTNGVSAVQAGSIQSDDLAAGVGGVGTEIIPKTTSTNVSEVDIDLSGGAYNRVVVEITDLQVSSNGVNAFLRVIKDGNTSPDTGSSDYAYDVGAVGTSSSNQANASGLGISLNNGGIGNNDQGESFKCTIIVRGARDPSVYTSLNFQNARDNSAGNMENEAGGGFRRSAQDDSTLRIYLSGSNISSITYQVWGYE